MVRFHFRDKVRWHRLTKTKEFETIEQLTSFMVTHLYELYDEYENMTEEYGEDSIYCDYILGSIDTTQVYLLKCGVEYLDHTAYIEKLENAKWVKA
jgi:hypothetical protein